MEIRPFREENWPAVWNLLRNTFAAGDTYAFAPDSGEDEIRRAWVDMPLATFVAHDGDLLLGTCFLKPNQQVVGRLPGAFRHQRLGYVDALVMFKSLAV